MNRDTVKKILIKKKKDTLCSLMERLDITQMSISPQISIEFKFNSNYNITGFSPWNWQTHSFSQRRKCARLVKTVLEKENNEMWIICDI